MDDSLNSKVCDVDRTEGHIFEQTSYASRSLNQTDLMYVAIESDSGRVCVDWVKRSFPNRPVMPFRFNGKNISNGLRFSVIFVAQCNINSMIQFLRDNDEELYDKIRIACMSESTPEERAKLLLGGFDDVFNMSTMPGVEAAMRVDAITSRYMQVKLSHKLERERQERLNRIADVNALTNRELNLIEYFAEREDVVISYRTICGILKRDGKKDISKRHLAVIIHGVKEKLRNGFRILSVRDEGYILKRNSV